MPRATFSPSVVALPPGLRSTRAARALLVFFAAQPDAELSAAEVEVALAQAGIKVNRVTAYRLLERLTTADVLRRRVDMQRVARFGLAAASDEKIAPRFECDDCQRQFRLSQGSEGVQSALRQILKALACAGHEDLAVDIAVRGRCAGCAHPAEPAA